jgi:hypothetical protein
LDINGNRLLLPLAIGVNVPDERMAHFIKMWNLLEDKKPGGTSNYSFFRIIIATEGDYLKDFPPNRHILYPDIGEKGRDPLDSLLGMEGNDVKTQLWEQSNGAYANISGDLGYLEQLSKTNTLLEVSPREMLPPDFQKLVLVISP